MMPEKCYGLIGFDEHGVFAGRADYLVAMGVWRCIAAGGKVVADVKDESEARRWLEAEADVVTIRQREAIQY